MEIVVRATFIFFFLLLVTRGLKRRSLADMAPFEMVLLILLGDITQQGITQEDFSLTGAVLAASTMAFWVTVLAYVTWRFQRAEHIIDGVPLVIVEDGKPVMEALALERMPLDEVFEAARQEGLDSLDQIRYAVLEPGGKVSFIKKEG